MKSKLTFKLICFCILHSAFCLSMLAQGTSFTYQGRLNGSGTPVGGSYDFRFVLYDNSVGGSQQGPILTNSATAVTNGLFTAALDFGNQFPGAARWLEIAVRTNGNGSFNTLSPRQPLSPAPYAITAGAVVSGGIPAGTYGNAVTFSNAANSFSGAFSGSGSGLTGVNAATLGGFGASNFWNLSGNAATSPGANFVGTSDNQPLEIKVNGTRALRLEPTPTNGAVNVVAGSPNNKVSAGVVGATIAGGGTLNYFGGAYSNSVQGVYGTIGGGLGNLAGNSFPTVAGGFSNIANGDGSVVGGGNGNSATNAYATVSGGIFNVASGKGATVGGGGTDGSLANANIASGDASTIGGGVGNLATSILATVGGGHFNHANGGLSTVSGGFLNRADGDASTVGGGDENVADGSFATVPGGYLNTAHGDYSFAAGRKAQANHNGAFVWADSQLIEFASSANDQFLIRAAGGVGIGVTNPAAVLHVASGSSTPELQLTQNNASDFTRLRMKVGSFQSWEIDVSPGATPSLQFWNSTLRMNLDYNGNLTTSGTVNGVSDRNLKEKFENVSARAVLDKVTALPISTWNFKSDPAIRHLGPMAQDFYAAFNLGMDDKHIATVDADGVALAAIQGLNQKVEDLRTELKRRDAENAELKQRLEALEQRAGH